MSTSILRRNRPDFCSSRLANIDEESMTVTTPVRRLTVDRWTRECSGNAGPVGGRDAERPLARSSGQVTRYVCQLALVGRPDRLNVGLRSGSHANTRASLEVVDPDVRVMPNLIDSLAREIPPAWRDTRPVQRLGPAPRANHGAASIDSLEPRSRGDGRFGKRQDIARRTQHHRVIESALSGGETD